jgi:hypothetical protein
MAPLIPLLGLAALGGAFMLSHKKAAPHATGGLAPTTPLPATPATPLTPPPLPTAPAAPAGTPAATVGNGDVADLPLAAQSDVQKAIDSGTSASDLETLAEKMRLNGFPLVAQKLNARAAAARSAAASAAAAAPAAAPTNAPASPTLTGPAAAAAFSNPVTTTAPAKAAGPATQGYPYPVMAGAAPVTATAVGGGTVVAKLAHIGMAAVHPIHGLEHGLSLHDIALLHDAVMRAPKHHLTNEQVAAALGVKPITTVALPAGVVTTASGTVHAVRAGAKVGDLVAKVTPPQPRIAGAVMTGWSLGSLWHLASPLGIADGYERALLLGHSLGPKERVAVVQGAALAHPIEGIDLGDVEALHKGAMKSHGHLTHVQVAHILRQRHPHAAHARHMHLAKAAKNNPQIATIANAVAVVAPGAAAAARPAATVATHGF